MILEKRRRTHLLPDEASIWISISDLMAGLLIVFILTLTYYMLSYTEKTDQITKNQEIKEEIFNRIKTQMDERNFTVRIDEKQWVLRMQDKVLFSSCSADMKKMGKTLIESLGEVMFSVFNIDKYHGSIETVFIEGHTDNYPPGTHCPFPSNWELSTQRAINTWRVMSNKEPQLGSILNVNKEKLFSVSGYGETRPLVSNKTSSGREKNRRIDIRIAMIPPSKEKRPEPITKIEGKFSGYGGQKN
jgi:chemotaxis protein MotB